MIKASVWIKGFTAKDGIHKRHTVIIADVFFSPTFFLVCLYRLFLFRMSDLRYPIGRFIYEAPLTPEQRGRAIGEIAALPAALRSAASGLDDVQLDTPYRENGWTLRQVVHHLADSHANAYIRFRLALTEDAPRVKPYDEAAWASLTDAYTLPVSVSLTLLDALHIRWSHLLARMSETDFQRTYVHPDHEQAFSLDYATGMYAWHGRHHLSHILGLRKRENW